MTAKAINDGHDNYTTICPQCPDFTGAAFGQLATVEVLRKHDRRFHPQLYVAPATRRRLTVPR